MVTWGISEARHPWSFRVWGLGFGVLGFRILGFGGLGFRVLTLELFREIGYVYIYIYIYRG